MNLEAYVVLCRGKNECDVGQVVTIFMNEKQAKEYVEGINGSLAGEKLEVWYSKEKLNWDFSTSQTISIILQITQEFIEHHRQQAHQTNNERELWGNIAVIGMLESINAIVVQMNQLKVSSGV